MTKKILVAGGCSYTDEKYIIQDPDMSQEPGLWPMWPKYLGDKLGLETVNTGKSGYSNESIFHSVLEKILFYKNRVDTVAVLWTEFDRSRFYGIFDWMPLSEVSIALNENPCFPDGESDFENHRARMGLDKVMFNFFNSEDFWRVREYFIRNSIHDSFRYIIALGEYCRSKNIKFIFFGGLGPFQIHRLNYLADAVPFKLEGTEDKSWIKTDDSKFINFYMNNINFSIIEKEYKKNIIGWPISSSLGGYSLDDLRYRGEAPFHKRDDQWNVSSKDMHPNAEAQRLAAEVFYEHWRKIYA